MDRRYDNRGYNNGDFEDSYYPRRRSSSDADRRGGRGDFPDDNVYRTIRITNLNPRYSDRDVSDVVYREFRKFGEFNVKVTYYSEKRIAFVNFRHAEDAVAAMREFYNRLILFDYPVRLGAVYPKPPPSGVFVGDRSEPRTSRGYSPGRRMNIEVDFPKRNFGPREDDDRSDGSNLALRQRHLQPEDDSYACRTLFVGNVDPDISSDELKAVFERYGFVEDIDIKKPPAPSGSPYAFIRFFNLDMAHLAKVKLSGKFIGPYQCKIGYGKPALTSCVWVGGLGPWVNKRKLAREFERFGDIERVVWPDKQTFAYVAYDNVESAKDAVARMRGFRFKDAERRLRVDFVDSKHMESELNHKLFAHSKSKSLDRHRSVSGSSARSNSVSPARSTHSKSSIGSQGQYRNRSHKETMRPTKRRGPSSDGDHSSMERKNFSCAKKQKLRAASESSNNSVQSKSSIHNRARVMRGSPSDEQINSSLELRSVGDMILRMDVVWNGLLTLKNSAFHVQMHLVSGNPNLVELLMCDASMSKFTSLKLTQRLRLDPPKLEEVRRRIQLSGNDWSILLGVPGCGTPIGLTSGMQERSLKNLVTYLRQKEAAGVLSLPPNSAHGQETGLLHTFAPCAFAHEYLLQRAPKLGIDPLAEDYIVVILVRVNI